MRRAAGARGGRGSDRPLARVVFPRVGFCTLCVVGVWFCVLDCGVGMCGGICVWRGMYGVFFVGPSGVLFCEFGVSVRWFL